MGRSAAILGMAAAIALAAGAAPTLAGAQPARTAPQCFRSSDWNGWKATPDGGAMYISTGLNRLWRFDMAQPCPELNEIDAKLITRTSTSWTCHPLDVDLRILRPIGVITHCQVRRITRLPPAEAKALPRNLRP